MMEGPTRDRIIVNDILRYWDYKAVGVYLKSKVRVSFKKCSQQSPANLARFIGIGKPI